MAEKNIFVNIEKFQERLPNDPLSCLLMSVFAEMSNILPTMTSTAPRMNTILILPVNTATVNVFFFSPAFNKCSKYLKFNLLSDL